MRRPSRRAVAVVAMFLAGSGVAVAAGVIRPGVPAPPESGVPGSPASVAQWPLPPDVGPIDLAAQENSRAAQLANLAALQLARAQAIGATPAAYLQPGAPIPTVVLAPRRAPYGLASLQRLARGAVAVEGHGVYLVRANVLVQSGATLRLASGRDPLTVRLLSGSDGFVSVMSFGGRIELAGSKQAPVTVESWDPQAKTVDGRIADGRAYVRAVGGSLSVNDGRFVSLGFSAGPTSGVVAGRATSPKLAGLLPDVDVRDSEFVGGVDGLLVTGASRLAVTGSTFGHNLLSGLELHQPPLDSVVSRDSAQQNGLDGFSVRGGSGSIALDSDTATANRRYGFTVDGRSLAGTVVAGAQLTAASAIGNEVAGVDLNEVVDSSVRSSTVADGPIGVIVSGAAEHVAIDANTMSGLTQRAVYVRDGADGVNVADNQIRKTATAVLVRDSSVTVSGNDVAISVYGDRLRHAVSYTGSVGDSAVFGNSFSGAGWSAVATSGVQMGTVAVRDDDLATWRRMQGAPTHGQPVLTWPTVARVIMIFLFGLLAVGRYRPGSPKLPLQRTGEPSPVGDVTKSRVASRR